MMKFSLIAALDQKNGIGKKQGLPWHLPQEMKYFQTVTTSLKDQTKQNAVIMGRKTWDSIPVKYRPLSQRINLVLSRSHQDLPGNVFQSGSMDEALTLLEKIPNLENIFIIGGASIYEQAIHHPACQKIYLTKIQQAFDCDTFFPQIPATFNLIAESELQTEENRLTKQLVSYRFLLFEKQ